MTASDPGGPAGPAGGRLPDFFIVGHPKSGTTALHEMLRRHPQVFMPDNKEQWFFAEELHERTPPRPAGTPRTLAEYEAAFAPAKPGQLAGEATPFYLWSRTAADRIAEVRPDARIVAIFREPARFLHSLHLQWVETYVETETDFARALALEPARRAGREIPRYTYWPKALMYSDFVHYAEQLRRYHERFGREQVKVLLYEDFRADNEATVREVLAHLGIEDLDSFPVLEANPTVGVRNRRLHHLVHAVSVGHGPVSQAVKASVKAVTPRQLRRDALRMAQERVVFADPLPPEEELQRELRRRFKGR